MQTFVFLKIILNTDKTKETIRRYTENGALDIVCA